MAQLRLAQKTKVRYLCNINHTGKTVSTTKRTGYSISKGAGYTSKGGHISSHRQTLWRPARNYNKIQRKAQQLAMAAQQRHHVDGNNCKLDFEAEVNIMKCNLRSKTAQAIFDKESGQMLKYLKFITHSKYQKAWTHSSANEFGHLAQGVGSRIEGTNTIFFCSEKRYPR
jgi:hypothetical protein